MCLAGNEVEDLIEHHGQIPVVLSKPYTGLLIAHFTPHERKSRYQGRIGYSDCFDTHNYHDAGIRGGNGFFPPAPDRAGFATLFGQNEAEGLRLFHRLEMRASVYLRNYHRRRERRPLRPVLVPTPWGRISLWGNEFEYQWSQGVLGSHVLGSCYLALDEWIWTQLGANRPMEELCRLVLQRNGLAATAALLMCAIALKVKDPGVLDAAAPFLATARLWDYEARRSASLQSYKHPLGFRRLDRHFYEADRIWQRWRQRTFLTQDLLLRFHLQASKGAKSLLEAARQGWTIADLATYEDELQDEEHIGQLEQRLFRIRSDADPASVNMERDPTGQGIQVWIEPPAEQIEQIAQAQEEYQELGRVMSLINWVIRAEQAKAVDGSFTLPQAIELAKRIQESPPPKDAAEFISFRLQMSGSAIVGTAWVAAQFGSDVLLDEKGEWIARTIVAGCRALDSVERDASLVDGAVLATHPLLYGAKGAAALIARGRAELDVLVCARSIAAGRLTEPSAALLAACRS
jgi:hypothetical protein